MREWMNPQRGGGRREKRSEKEREGEGEQVQESEGGGSESARLDRVAPSQRAKQRYNCRAQTITGDRIYIDDVSCRGASRCLPTCNNMAIHNFYASKRHWGIPRFWEALQSLLPPFEPFQEVLETRPNFLFPPLSSARVTLARRRSRNSANSKADGDSWFDWPRGRAVARGGHEGNFVASLRYNRARRGRAAFLRFANAGHRRIEDNVAALAGRKFIGTLGQPDRNVWAIFFFSFF